MERNARAHALGERVGRPIGLRTELACLIGQLLVQPSADLFSVNLIDANLSGAVLSNALGLASSFGSAFYDANTNFTGTSFNPVAAGWMLVAISEPGDNGAPGGPRSAGMAVRQT